MLDQFFSQNHRNLNLKQQKNPFNFPKHWVLTSLFLLWIGFFSSSCQKTTTADLIPDSCTGLVKFDLPRIVPKLVANHEVVDSINHLIDLPLDDMGLNFFQPAFLYQKGGTSDFLMIFGISNDSKFSEVVGKKYQNQVIEKQDEFSTLWTGSWQLVWNEQFLLARKVDPLLGKPEWNPDWKNYFKPTEENGRSLPLEENADFSWFWNIEEAFLGDVIPALEVKIKGTGNWNHPNLVVESEIEEHQYLALLKPFTSESSSNQLFQAMIWPALESILLQIESYGGNRYKNEMNSKILDLIKKMDHPFECLLVENQSADLLKAIQVKTQYQDQNNALALEKEIKNMLPNSVLDQYSIAQKEGEVSFFHKSSQAIFSKKTTSDTSIKNLILGIFQKDSTMQTQVKLQLAKPGFYKFTLNATNPERVSGQPFFRQIISLKPDTIMSQFLPNAYEKIP